MHGKRAFLERLQTLQSSHPLELPPACLGTVGLARLSPRELFRGEAEAEAEAGAGAGGAGGAREALRLAEFWISLLEGEHSELGGELAKHRQRHQLALRQSEAKASALREAEGERRRLQAELRALRRDRAGATGAEPSRDRAEDEAGLEEQLVRTKVRYAEALQRADSLQCLVEYYEDQLRVLNPSFEPADLATVGHLLRPSHALDASELESDASGANDQHSVVSGEKPKSSRRSSLRAGISKMKQMFNRRDGREAPEQPALGECPSFGSATPHAEEDGRGPPAASPATSDAEPEAGRPGARPKRWQMRRE